MHVYTIELSGIASHEALHAELARGLSLPGYYGCNWDAFDECIEDVVVPASVQVLGFDGFRLRLPREAKLLAECLRAVSERWPPGLLKVDGLA